MPGSLLTMFLGWLATHLVALTALLFLLVWLVLSGTLAVPGYWTQVSQSRHGQAASSAVTPVERTVSTEAGIAAQPTTVITAAATSEARPASPAGSIAKDVAAAARPADDASEPVRSQPRMIGGTIPLYGDSTGGFRPPASTPMPSTIPGYDDLVQQARRSFWNGDFEAAERTYMDIVERYPDDVDVYGELGNLYIAMGKNALALDAYFEAGLRLKAIGERGRLVEVAEILKKNGDDRGLQLNPNR